MTKNEHCPLQNECERKCRFHGHEQECDYFHANVRPGAGIDPVPGFDLEEELRDIEIITSEILEAKRVGGEAVLTIGRGLIEAKAMLGHGDWLPWLTERVEFSERSAQNFMRIAREYSNPQLVADLGARKALQLLALPEAEREEFVAGHNVVDMTSRELEKVIRELKETQAELNVVRTSHDSLAENLKLANSLLARAQEEKAQAVDAVSGLERQLAEVKAAPVDVAVMAVDQEAIDKARAEAVAELKIKLDKARAAKKTSDEKRRRAEAAVDTLKLQLAEAARAKQQTDAMADPDVARFEVYFNQAQEVANKLRGLLLKARGREDQTAAEKLSRAMLALGDKIKEAAQ